MGNRRVAAPLAALANAELCADHMRAARHVRGVSVDREGEWQRHRMGHASDGEFAVRDIFARTLRCEARGFKRGRRKVGGLKTFRSFQAIVVVLRVGGFAGDVDSG